MFKNKTVFIVGAGASDEAGLPIGTTLAKTISENLNFQISSTGRRTKGSPCIFQKFDQYSGELKINKKELFRAGCQISNSIFYSETIDNYIDTHQHDPIISLCGKTAIIHAILEAERKSKLHIDQTNGNSTLNQNKIKDTWYVGFAKILFERITYEKIESLFDNIAIICFNYDRCIQQFLIHAIASHYGVSQSESEKLVTNLKIYQPYGSIGKLFGNGPGHSIPFGEKPERFDLLALANSIKTYTEQIEGNDLIKNIQKEVSEAETIVFLGFGFHPQNLDLLALPPSQNTPPNSKSVFATGFGFSEFNLQEISKNIARRLNISTNPSNPRHNSIHIKNLQCSTLFSEFNFGLRAR